MATHYVYILTNAYRTMFYVGTTHALHQALFNHNNGRSDPFAKKYNCKYMVFYEERETKEAAEIRKSEITSRPKTKQIDFIVSKNPNLDEIEL